MASVRHSKSFQLRQPVDVLFPLFSAEGERLWAPGWDYENVMDGSIELHEDYIFLTENHDHASGKAVWLIKRYAHEIHYIEFYKVEPDDKVATISVKCTELEDGYTEVTVSYVYTAISPKGEEFLKSFTWQAYSDFIDEWQKHLLIYFDN